MAQPMRCVKLTLRGAICALSSFRRASSVATSTSRKLVAVGTSRLAFMFWARRAAGPLIGVAPSGREVAAGCEVVPATGAISAVGCAPERPFVVAAACAPAVIGSKPPDPASKVRRHSADTLEGSARYCS